MNDLEKSLKKLENLLLWGVETDEEIKAICDEVLKDSNYKFYKLDFNPNNPFHKPKSEWTEEMHEQLADFLKKMDKEKPSN